jgi:hypothetical protein
VATKWPIVPALDDDDDDECGANVGMSGRGNLSMLRKLTPSAALFTTNPT